MDLREHRPLHALLVRMLPMGGRSPRRSGLCMQVGWGVGLRLLCVLDAGVLRSVRLKADLLGLSLPTLLAFTYFSLGSVAI